MANRPLAIPDAADRGAVVAGRDVTSRVARNALHLAIGQAGTTALAIVLSAALGRALGARDFGLYFLVTSIATFAYVFVEWGQPPLVMREVARRPSRAGVLLGTVLEWRAILSAVVVPLLVLMGWALGYDARTRLLLLLYYAAMFPFFASQAFGMVFRGRDRMGSDAFVGILNRAAGLILIVAVLARGGGLVGVALAQFAAGTIAVAAATFLYRRLGAPPLAPTRRMARILATGGAPLMVITGVSAFQPYLDAVILSTLVAPEVVGWYAVAKTISGPLVAPASLLGVAWYPHLSRAAADDRTFRAAVNTALRPMAILGALGAAGTYLFAGTAVRVIYGDSGFGPAATVLEVLSPAVFILFVDTLLANTLVAAGHSRTFAFVKVASVAVGIVLDLVLVPWSQGRYGNGGIGVAVAFAVSELVVFAGAAARMPRGTLVRTSLLDAAKALLAGGATVMILKSLPALHAAVAIPLCIAAFLVIAAALRLVHRQDFAVAIGVLRSLRPGATPSSGS